MSAPPHHLGITGTEEETWKALALMSEKVNQEEPL